MNINNELYDALKRLTTWADGWDMTPSPEQREALKQAYAAMAKAKGVALEPVTCQIKPFLRIGREI